MFLGEVTKKSSQSKNATTGSVCVLCWWESEVQNMNCQYKVDVVKLHTVKNTLRKSVKFRMLSLGFAVTKISG